MKILAGHSSVLILALSCFAFEANGISDETKSNETDTAIEYILRIFGDPPAVVLSLPENKNSSLNYRFAAEHQDEKISLILESMTCRPNGEEPSPSLQILGDNSFLDICANIVYPEDSFDAVKYSLAGEHSYEVNLQGDWTRSKAFLVATVYKEASSCSKCPKDTFCCAGGSKCKGETRAPNQASARCISNSLGCDRHPNCGMVCNADESDELCKPYDYYYDFNFGYMTILAFTFLMLLPCAIILLGCYHRHMTQMKRLRALELRRRQNLENICVTSTIPPNDHPPTYAEVHETQEQPPCFCEAIKLPTTTQSNSATTNSADNAGVGTEGNEQNCTCGKTAGQQRY